MSNTRLLVLLTVAGLTATVAWGDTIRLRNGVRLTGKVVKRTDSLVSVDVGGRVLDLKLDRIESIDGEPVRPSHQARSTAMAPAKVRRDGDRVAAVLRGLAKKPSPRTIAGHAKAKRKVIREPDSARVVHISDRTFFEAIDPSLPGMEPIMECVRAKDYDAAWRALDRYLRENLKPVGELRDVAGYRKRWGSHKPGGTDRRADRICQHVIRVWHSQVVDFGKDMDWTGVNGRSSLAGFHYWGWASPLWTAYVRTGNEKYAAGFDDLFSSWYAQRPKVSKACSNDFIWYELGCGCRPMQFARLYYAMLPSKSLRMDTRKLVLKTLLGHANQLQAQQACGYTDGNFQLTASKALYQIGLAFPIFTDAATWRETATARLLEHAYWDFDKEGGHHERCIGYGSISMRAVRQLLIYAADDPSPSPLMDELRRKVLGMQMWFLRYVTPSGVFVGVNDSSMQGAESLLIGFATFANDGRFLWPIRDGKRVPKGIKPKKPDFLSVFMPGGGWAFMRDGWEKGSFYMLANWGPYGGGHTHPAIFDVDVYAHGEPMVIEASRFDSYDNPRNTYFRSPEAHNMVTIAGRTLDRKKHHGEHVVWRSHERADYLEGDHRGYEAAAGVVIKRRVLFVKGLYWLVVDSIRSAKGGVATAELNWHSPYRWRRTETGLIARAESRPGVQVAVLPKGEPGITAGYENEKLEMYGSRYRAAFQQPATDGACFVTLLLPHRGQPQPCGLELLQASPGGLAIRIKRGSNADRVLLALGKRRPISGGDMETDARVAWVRERPRAAFIVDGSVLTFRGEPVVALESARESADQ